MVKRDRINVSDFAPNQKKTGEMMMIEIHRIEAGSVNCYIAAENGRAVLIDTGRKKYREKILKKCKEFHVSLIILTHGHLDHCQNAAYLANALQIPIAMSEKDLKLIPDNRTQALSARTFLGKIVLLASLKSFEKEHFEAFEPAIYLKDGDSLRQYGIDAKIIALPGHTQGSIGIAFYDNLFVGDALMNMFYPTVSMLYTDEQEMLASAQTIRALGEKIIFFGHGKPKQNGSWK